MFIQILFYPCAYWMISVHFFFYHSVFIQLTVLFSFTLQVSLTSHVALWLIFSFKHEGIKLI